MSTTSKVSMPAITTSIPTTACPKTAITTRDLPPTVTQHQVSTTFSSRVAITGMIDDIELDVLLDTGANVSCISTAAWDKLNETGRYCLTSSPHAHGTAANDTRLTFVGRVKLPLVLQDTLVEHNFYVCTGLSNDCILGSDFFTGHRGILDFTNYQLSFDASYADSYQDIPVTVYSKTLIPAYSESDVVCRVDGEVQGTVMIEPNANYPGNVSAASSVAAVRDDNLVYVRVMNTGPQAMLFKRGRTVGCARAITSASIFSISSEQQKNEDKKSRVQNKLGKISYPDNADMTSTEKTKFASLMEDYQDLFSEGAHDLGQTDVTHHTIDTGDARPIKGAARRVPMHRRDALNDMISEMETNDVVRKSNSPWASPVVLAPKKDGTLRFCVDYRALNEITRRDAYPLPRIDDILEALKDAKYYCHLDLASGYWQVKMADKDIAKTAFCIPGGLYEFLVMPFGLTNAPPTFQRLMNTVLRDHMGIRALVYLDDIIVWGATIEETMANLQLVFDSVRTAGLKFKPAKCKFFLQSLNVLGHVVSPAGISTDPAKAELIKNWPEPCNVREVRSFLGLASYYRKFIRNFAHMARPLTALTAKSVPFRWQQEQQTAFDVLKQALSSPPVLTYPTSEGTFVLDTDASNNAIGAVLSQIQPGESLSTARVVAFGSKTLSDAERNYDTRRKELLTAIYFLEHFRYYLEAKSFHLLTYQHTEKE
jgi:hypothetical protein